MRDDENNYAGNYEQLQPEALHILMHTELEM